MAAGGSVPVAPSFLQEKTNLLVCPARRESERLILQARQTIDQETQEAEEKLTKRIGGIAISLLESSLKGIFGEKEQKTISAIKSVVVKESDATNIEKVNAPDLKANVLDSVKEEKDINSYNSKPGLMPWLFALSGFTLISLFSIFLFRKSPKPQTQGISKEAEDYEIEEY